MYMYTALYIGALFGAKQLLLATKWRLKIRVTR